jgi:hypothetical protein
MSTRINVTTTQSGLVERAKQVQDANREAQLQKERDGKTEEEVKTELAEQQEQLPVGGSIQPGTNSRPAAMRKLGSVMGVEYQTQTIFGVPNPTFEIRVGPPGLDVSVTADTLAPSGNAASNQPPTVSTESGAESVLGFLTTFAPDFFGNTYRTEYPCGYTFQTGSGAPPTSSWTDNRFARVELDDYDDSAAYLLPVGRETSIFVYVYSKLRTLTVFERVSRVDRTSVNPRAVSSGCGGQAGTYYDRQSTFTTTDNFDNIEERSAYKIFAFVVSPTAVRELDVPNALDAQIRLLHPPMEVNSTQSVLNSSTYQRFEFIDQSPPYRQNYDTPETYGYTSVPIFDQAIHRANSLHGNYGSRNDVLAKQFGMGYLDTGEHDGPFYTPAVYSFIGSAMSLANSADAQSYSYMRSTYFSRAPQRYLAPCVDSDSCEDSVSVGFDVTASAPTNIDEAMLASAFAPSSRYVVKLNGSSRLDVTYGWDWDQPSYCRQQLAALGFTTTDLTP